MNFPLGLKLGCRATGERYVCPTARRTLDVSSHLLFVLPLLGYRRSVVFQLDDRVITAIERDASVGRVGSLAHAQRGARLRGRTGTSSSRPTISRLSLPTFQPSVLHWRPWRNSGIASAPATAGC